MKVLTKLLVLSALALVFGVISAPNAFATIPEGSYLRAEEPIDVGGTVLQPGVYVIRVLPEIGNRNLLQVTNEDGSKVYATVLSIPHAYPSATEQANTEYVYYPAITGSPRALRTWFAPNSASGGGHDIVYPQGRAMELAPVVKEPVVAYVDDTKPVELKIAKLVVVTPEKVVTEYVEPTPAPKPAMTTEPAPKLAMTTEPAPKPAAKAAELPRTASRLPLLATLGLLLLGVAVGIRALRAV